MYKVTDNFNRMISIGRTNILRGEIQKLFLVNDQVCNYSQVQVEVFNTGVPNPKSVLGFGTNPEKIEPNKYFVSFNTSTFNEGIYEIKLLRLHTPIIEGFDEQKDYHGGKDFNRIFFKVTQTDEAPIKESELMNFVIEKEKENEKQFLSEINISKSENPDEYTAFVLVKGLKTGIRYRLNNIEVFPLNKGLDSVDTFSIANHFLKYYTRTGSSFDYNEEVSQEYQSQNPVSIVHFPKIISDKIDDVVNFAHKKTEYLLQAFSLIRGASANIFNILVVDINKSKIFRFLPPELYIGNMLTGGLSGENPSVLNAYMSSLESDSFKSLLVSLHKEALSEKNESFVFLRFWNILETLAENKNYDSEADLLDFNGNIIYENSNPSAPQVPKKIKDSPNINKVYNLIKEHKIGNTEEVFDNVKMWLGLRNATAHFGSIYNYEQLGSSRDKRFVKKAIEIIQAAKGHNPILLRLKEDVKMILMNELL